MELSYGQSADLHAAKRSSPGSFHRQFTKSLRTPHKDSAKSSKRIYGLSVANSSD